VQSTRVEYETRKEAVPVRYIEHEAITRTVRRPVTRQTYKPYYETVMVPQQVVQRAPMNYFDPYAAAIRTGYSSFSTPLIASAPISSSEVISSSKVVVQPDDSGSTILEGPSIYDDTPRTSLQNVEIGSPEPAQSIYDQEPAELKLDSPDPSDNDAIDAPELEAKEAGFPIQWMPKLARRT
jgi:hypothetical protein